MLTPTCDTSLSLVTKLSCTSHTLLQALLPIAIVKPISKPATTVAHFRSYAAADPFYVTDTGKMRILTINTDF